jgi:hypothetical protein
MTGLATKSVKYSRPEYFLGGDSATKQTIAQKRSAESSTVVHMREQMALAQCNYRPDRYRLLTTRIAKQQATRRDFPRLLREIHAAQQILKARVGGNLTMTSVVLSHRPRR